MANDLSKFALQRPQRALVVPDIPSLHDKIKDVGLLPGLKRIDEENRKFRQDLEQRLQQAFEAATPAATVTATATPATTNDGTADALAKHIAATQVHGTVGNVVGERNEQTIDKKALGTNDPRAARVTTLVSRNSLKAGEVLRIAPDESMIVAEEFIVEGDLTIDGILLVVTNDEPPASGSTGVTDRFDSGLVALSTGAEILNVAHGRGQIPIPTYAFLVPQSSPELGYAVGELVPIDCFMDSPSGFPPFSIRLTETHIIVRQGNVGLYGIDASSGAASALDYSKWMFKIIVER